MLSNCELPVIPDTQENLEEIVEHSFSVTVMLGCLVPSAQSRLMNAVSHLDVLRVNLDLADHVTTLSSSGCIDAMITSFLRAITTSSA